jgi:hypothetical protein
MKKWLPEMSLNVLIDLQTVNKLTLLWNSPAIYSDNDIFKAFLLHPLIHPPSHGVAGEESPLA